ncbi:MAG TPA: hydrogenase maturation protease [Acidobacteriota bacterium]|nr:hydrogenase maturation protease [Acidobacteriota bacterium]
MSSIDRAPVLVLGVGNILLGDDGAGVHLVKQMPRLSADWNGTVELLEGGTQGLALLGDIAGRSALVLLDAAALGAVPGTVHVRRDGEVLELSHRGCTAHEGNAGELLAVAGLLGELPQCIMMVGIEPLRLETGIGLSEPVQQAIPAALEAARQVVDEALLYLRHSGSHA